MKILFLSYDDCGIPIALAHELLKQKIDVVFGVFQKLTNFPFVVEIPRKQKSLVAKIIKKICSFLRIDFYKYSTTNPHPYSTNFYSKVDVNWINNQNADIIHLHWIGNDFLSISDIAKIKQPIVWTLHDEWAFCGAEHCINVLEKDNRYTQKYTSKNKPATSKGFDVAKKTWKLKNRYLTNKNISFIGPSSWIADCCKNSALFKNKRCEIIPNVYDSSIFKPYDKMYIRKILGVPLNKKILGFGAAYGGADKKSPKGTYYLLEVLKKLPNPDEYCVLIFGPSSSEVTSLLNTQYIEFGYLSNPRIVSLVYNAMDVYLNPSLIEALSGTSVEASLCGVPQVVFNFSGPTDIVIHKKTGYLANYLDIEDFYNGIEFCFSNLDFLSKNARESVLQNFDADDVVKKHIELYNSICNSN